MLDWFHDGPKDVGVSSSSVLRAAGARRTNCPAQRRAYFQAHPRGGAGNGSLMRTAPVALAFLGDDEAIDEHARRLSLLTHGDPLAAEACSLWCIAIDRAVRERRFDGIHDGLALLDRDRARFWSARLA